MRFLLIISGFASFASPVFAAVVFQNPLQGNSLLAIICTVADKLFGILGVLGVIAFLVAAFFYLTAGGNAQKAETGKKVFIAAVTGIALAILAFGLPSIIASLFGVPASSLPASCQ